jgi:hypothetical protein
MSIEKSHLEEVIFPVGKWPGELIIFLLDDLKNHFCVVEEVMYRESWESKKRLGRICLSGFQ